MSDEVNIRDLLEARAQAIGVKDAESVVSFYSEDVVDFDLAPPLAQRGRNARNRRSCEDG